VVAGPDVSDPSFKYDKPLTVTVNRDGKDVTFIFRARGKAITGYRWARNPRISDAQCKL
jgi:hypothetical protein